MWFKSKAQHADPMVRRSYVETLPSDDELLLRVATDDPHPDVRGAAVARLIDLEALQQLASQDADSQIRARAVARLQTVVAGAQDEPIPIAERLDFMSGCESRPLLEFVARTATEPELRRQAVGKLLALPDSAQLEALFCEIAGNDSVGEIRELAANAVHSESGLAKLAQLVKSRDKTVFRLAQERLDKLRALAAAEQAVISCCEDAEQLAAQAAGSDMAAVEARLATIQKSWDANIDAARASGSLDASVPARFEEATGKTRAQLEQTRELRRERNEIIERFEAYRDGGDAAVPVAELTTRWHELGTASPAETRQFERVLHDIHELDSQRDRDRDRAERAAETIAEAQAALEGEGLTAGEVERLDAKWRELPMPQDAGSLREQFADVHQKMKTRLEQEAAAEAADLDKIAALIETYEKALSDGQLRQALSAHDKAASALERSTAPEGKRRSLQERLRSHEPRLNELRKWRHWGTQRAREQLCQRAEGLATLAAEPPAIAREVRECRDAWKALDKADGAASKALWERFDTACEKAYEPCQAYFDEQKKSREKNMARRVLLCERLEKLAAETDWDAPPWREVTDALRDTQRKWHRAGPVDRREKNKIGKRFKKACEALDAHLGVERDRERARREALIERIEGIAPDARDSLRQVKQAQREWKPLVQSDRRTERDLWTRFRTACDAIFERHRSQIAAADEERAQHLGEKKAVIAQIEAMTAELRAGLDGSDIDAAKVEEARKKLNQLRNGWKRIGPVPRDAQKDIEQQFRTACDSLSAVGRELDSKAAMRALEALRSAAANCDRFERDIADGLAVDAAEVEMQLSACGNDEAMQPVRERLLLVQKAASGDAGAAETIRGNLQDNLTRKQQLCLELEIAANIDSPPEHEQERMQYRVGQLSASLSGRQDQRNAEALQREWFATGAVPADAQQALEQRFQRAMTALGAR